MVLENGLFELLPGPPDPHASNAITATTNGTGKEEASKTEEVYTTYQRLNHPRSEEKDVELETDRIAKGLFSTLATMGEYFETTIVPSVNPCRVWFNLDNVRMTSNRERRKDGLNANQVAAPPESPTSNFGSSSYSTLHNEIRYPLFSTRVFTDLHE